jgi:hypothetical protein
MSLALAIAGWTLFALAVVAGLALDAMGLFGNWIILGAVATAWAASGFAYFSLTGLAIMLGLAILGEAAEAVAAGYGARRFGGGKGTGVAAVVGTLLGAVFGTPIFPVIGTLIGACLGAFAAALLFEFIRLERKFKEAAWTGFGAALGRIGGLVAKLGMGAAMLVVAALTF